MQEPFSSKQLEFIINSVKPWNLAHGSVSTGKTVCSTFRFMQAVDECPDNDIAMIGKASATLYNNIITLIFESPQLSIFRPFCTWFPSDRTLRYKDKRITTYGAKDEGSTQLIQGRTLSLAYCDEMTLFPISFINMLDSRLRKEHSMGFGAMNPAYPDHLIKKWIDKGEEGDPNYYSLHFTLPDNPYLTETYKNRIKNSLSGLFYKRNYLGLWCLAEGAIFDFFDRNIHVVERAPSAAEYFIAGIDYGTSNAFACVLLGVSTGKYTQTGKRLWVEKEYYWDSKREGRQKVNSEYANEVAEFLEPYGVKHLYIDPSAAAFKLELQRRGIRPIDANNDVENGIQMMCSEMQKGSLYVIKTCPNLIREIESYVWDSKAAERGWDQPLKKNDHAVDALRYCIASHKVSVYNPYPENTRNDQYLGNRFNPGTRRF
jgi:PBSX family phage terminase large subunit